MSDRTKPLPPGKELAHNGNTSPQPQPNGKELATVKNANLANEGNANLSY